MRQSSANTFPLCARVWIYVRVCTEQVMYNKFEIIFSFIKGEHFLLKDCNILSAQILTFLCIDVLY